MNGMVARQSGQNNSGWKDALQNCFRGNITLSFETGRQNRMIISRAALWALDNPSHIDLLMDVNELTLLMLGTDFPNPASIQVGSTGLGPINQERQENLARLIERAGWKKGYRYTLNAMTLEMGRKTALCFDLEKAVMYVPARIPA